MKLFYSLMKLFNIRTNSKDIKLIQRIYIDYKFALSFTSDGHYNPLVPYHKFMYNGICWYAYKKYNICIYGNILTYNIIKNYGTLWATCGNIEKRLPFIKELLDYLEKNKHFKVIGNENT